MRALSVTETSRSTGHRRVLLALGMGALLFGLAHPAGAAKAPAVTPLWTDAKGDVKTPSNDLTGSGTARGPALDLLRGAFRCDRDNVHFVTNLLKIDRKALTGSPRYQVYRVRWTANGVERFVDAATGYGGDGNWYESWSIGSYKNGVETLEQTSTGKIVEGANASVTSTIPYQNVGLAPGTVITNIRAEAWFYTWYAFYLGGPTPQRTGTLVDEAATKLKVTIGAKGVCKTSK